MGRRMINIIAMVITTVWAISFLVDIIVPTYNPPESIHALMLIVAGAAFTGTVLKKNGDNT